MQFRAILRRRPRLRVPREQDDSSADEGWAAVDALVALTILASTTVFSIAALQTGRQAADVTLEARQSTALLREVIERAPPDPGVTAASTARFAWRVTVHAPVLTAGAAAMCRRDAVVTARRSGRTYALTSAEICPSGDA